MPLRFDHSHIPLYRVVRTSYKDPLDASYSQHRGANRWNTTEFPALYCCCSENVARAVTLDILRFAGLEMDDLKPDVRPQLVEFSWSGEVIDMTSSAGIASAGFPAAYPAHTALKDTQSAAALWREQGWPGVVCRSASMYRLGYSTWEGPHERWSELAIFVDAQNRNAQNQTRLLNRRSNLAWFI